MPIIPDNFLVSLNPNPIKVVLGFNGTVNLNFSNTSTIDRRYNLTVETTLPDGVSYVSSTINPDSIIEQIDGTIKITWTNIKDLAPNEVNFRIGLTLKSEEFFRLTGHPVPFDIPLENVSVIGTVDTLPRGNDDIGNEKIEKTISANFIPLRYNLKKSAPRKIPKGAGTPTSPQWPYSQELIITNNTREPSTVTLIDNFPNGLRYLDNLNVSGPDISILSSPTVITPTPGPSCQDFVTIDWGTVTLSANSENIITYDVAIWDNYTLNCVENSGDRIPHMTSLQNIATLDGISGAVQGQSTTKAMDITIDKSVTSNTTDVNKTNSYTLTYKVNQYDNIDFVTITDIIGDGEEYQLGSASIIPSAITVNIDGTTTIIWNLGTQTASSTGAITFDTKTKSSYISTEPVTAEDTLINNVSINGINNIPIIPTNTPDNSSTSIFIKKPIITKEVSNYYFEDLTIKPYAVAAPQDLVEFKITYDASSIVAVQKNIEIDEYAPLNMGPLTNTLPVTYTSTFPGTFSPFTVSPNGLRWALGDLPSNAKWTATFKVPVEDINFVGTKNNLAKLAGTNNEGFAYSSRDLAEVKFGEPNITLEKTVSGPDVNAIKAGETYTYSITISNPQNLDNTVVDAFEMDLTDIIPNDLIFNGNFTVTGTGIYTGPTFLGQNVSLTINRLAPDESLTLKYEVEVKSSIVSGQIYTNSAVLQRPYSQPDRSYQYPGEPLTDSATLKAEGITMTKQITPVFAEVGDEVTYLLNVKIPLGTTAFNVQVIDTFPAATQTYIPNTAKIDGVPVLPDSIQSGVLTFPTIFFIDATSTEIILVYKFKVRLTGFGTVPPFTEYQTDNATVNWNLDSSGTPAVPFSTSKNLEVRIPNIRGFKEQRNATQGQGFSPTNVNYEIGDIIEYRINLTNNGDTTAYNIKLTDNIDPLLDFNSGSISTNKGFASFNLDTITWNIDEINANDTATLIFSVTTLPGVPSASRIPNIASFSFNTNNNGFGIELGPIDTNKVRLVSPVVDIEKDSSITEGEIGDDILYTITVTVSEGTIAYSPVITDVLDTGQTYIGPASREQPPSPPTAVPNLGSGQNIIFPTNPNIDASAGEIQIIYKYTARITNAIHTPPFEEEQENNATVKWAITDSGTLNKSRDTNETITARTPNITILKEQRNVSTGGSYTTSNITALPGNIIYYRLTIDSNGASPAFNINLNDLLSDNLTFDSIISGPTVGSIILPPPGPGGLLEWNITQLNNGSNAILEFAVTVNSGIGASSNIPNASSSTYDSNDINPIQYTENSNEVIIDIPALEFAKTTSTSMPAAIGDTITYNLQITIPSGVVAYNLFIRDEIPAEQIYVPNSWNPYTPTVIGNVINFNDPVSPRIGPLVLNYTFQTEVIDGLIQPPYIEQQRNSSFIEWHITPTGPKAPPVSDFKNIEVATPHINSLKEQRNVTTGGSFTTNPIPGVSVGDTIEYRITLNNDGENTAYNTITTDILDTKISFQNIIGTPPGTVDINGNIITWTINTLNKGATAILVFSALVNSGSAPGATIEDQASTIYDTNPSNPTQLGPELSNKVGFDFTLPEIIKTVDDNSVSIGDIVTYKIEFTIPAGNIAYDVQINDSLPSTQSYISNSLKRKGISIPSPTLSFPPEGTIDATSGAVKIDYTFEAEIISFNTSPLDKQTNTATINWNLAPGSLPETPQNAIADVYVTTSDIIVEKAQKNFTTNEEGEFTTNTIQASIGDIIHYKLTITNTSSTIIYNIIAKDILSNFLQYIGPIESPPAGIVYHSGEASDGTITGNIASIPAGVSYSAIIAVKVLAGSGAQSTIENNYSATFTVTNQSPLIRFGPRISNTVTTELPSLEIKKYVSKDIVELGEIFTYTLEVTIPKGTKAYNIVVTDILPAEQSFEGEATKGGNPVFPTIDGQNITFGTEPFIDATSKEEKIIYTFKARVVSMISTAPYEEIQINNANVNWEIDSLGTKAIPTSTSQEITITRPKLTIFKVQRNVTKGTGFKISEINVEVGDIVEFGIVATSSGASPAYNIIITDILTSFNQYLGVSSVTQGNVNFEIATNTITWEIDELESSIVAELYFQIEILEGISAGGSNTNIASSFYNSNKLTPITFGPIFTNEVRNKYPNVKITKIADKINVVVGDIITYTVSFILPNGTIAYNGQFTDILPIGQQYNNNATLNGAPITPVEINGQFIAFPIVPFASAISGDLPFEYKFEALVVSSAIDPQTLIDIQTNEGRGHWGLTPTIPAPSVNAKVSINATNIVEVEKLQRNDTTGTNFTKDTINGFLGHIIQYSITVTNSASSPVYNVVAFDYLLSNLSFVGPVSIPIGTLTYGNGIVTWNIGQLNSDSVTAVFAIQIISDENDPINNLGFADFKINPSDTQTFRASSNIVSVDVARRPKRGVLLDEEDIEES